MSVPNQKIIDIHKAEYHNSSYTTLNIDILQQAMVDLKGETLKVWLYLCKNKSGFTLELSLKDAEKWGLKKDAYYRGIKQLEELGYLRRQANNSNVYHFYEDPNAADHSQIAKVNSSPSSPKVSQNAKVDENAELFAEGPSQIAKVIVSLNAEEHSQFANLNENASLISPDHSQKQKPTTVLPSQNRKVTTAMDSQFANLNENASLDSAEDSQNRKVTTVAYSQKQKVTTAEDSQIAKMNSISTTVLPSQNAKNESRSKTVAPSQIAKVDENASLHDSGVSQKPTKFSQNQIRNKLNKLYPSSTGPTAFLPAEFSDCVASLPCQEISYDNSHTVVELEEAPPETSPKTEQETKEKESKSWRSSSIEDLLYASYEALGEQVKKSQEPVLPQNKTEFDAEWGVIG